MLLCLMARVDRCGTDMESTVSSGWPALANLIAIQILSVPQQKVVEVRRRGQPSTLHTEHLIAKRNNVSLLCVRSRMKESRFVSKAYTSLA